MAPGAGIVMGALGMGDLPRHIESVKKARADPRRFDRPRSIWPDGHGNFHPMPPGMRGHKGWRNTPLMTDEEVAFMNPRYLDDRRRNSGDLSRNYVMRLFNYERSIWRNCGFTSPYKDVHGRAARRALEFNLWLFWHPRREALTKTMEEEALRGHGSIFDHFFVGNHRTPHRHGRSIDVGDSKYRPPYPDYYRRNVPAGLLGRHPLETFPGHRGPRSHRLGPNRFPGARVGPFHPIIGHRTDRPRRERYPYHALDHRRGLHLGRNGYIEIPLTHDPPITGPNIFVPRHGPRRHPHDYDYDYDNDEEEEYEDEIDDEYDDDDGIDSHSTTKSYVRHPPPHFIVPGFSHFDGYPLGNGHHHHNHHHRRRRNDPNYIHDIYEDDDNDNMFRGRRIGHRGRHRHGGRFRLVGHGGGFERGDLDYGFSGDEGDLYDI